MISIEMKQQAIGFVNLGVGKHRFECPYSILSNVIQPGTTITGIEVEKINEEGKDYTAEQWEKANEQFSKLLDKINSYEDLTEEELKEVAKLQGQYAATVFKNSGKAIMEQMEKAGAALGGFLEGVDEGLENQEQQTNP